MVPTIPLIKAQKIKEVTKTETSQMNITQTLVLDENTASLRQSKGTGIPELPKMELGSSV